MIIELLSPVFIGSGNYYQYGLDYLADDDKVYFLDREKLFSELTKGKGLSEDFFEKSTEFSLSKAREYFKTVNFDNIITYKQSIELNAKEVTEFMRDGAGEVFIPGSSIKGAIRSIIISDIFKNTAFNDRQRMIRELPGGTKNKQKAAIKFVDDLLSTTENRKEQSNYNMMRVLRVPDVYLYNPKTKIYTSKVISVNQYQKFNIKNFNIYNEALEPNQISIEYTNLINVENTLLKDYTAEKLNFNIFQKYFDFKSLAQTINNNSLNFLKEEKKFFENYDKRKPRKFKDTVNFYQKLIDKLEENPQDEFVLRIGAASGWKGMTGNIISDNQEFIDIVRGKYQDNKKRFGRKGVPLFPKSRRVRKTEDNRFIPFGWIRISKENNTWDVFDKTDSTNQNDVEDNSFNIEEAHNKLGHLMR